MSVLIKGMKMPKDCGSCFMGKYWTCRWLDGDAMQDDRLPNCPLIEVPPHGRLIDADELYERAKMRSERFNGCFNDLDNVINALYIETFPTIIPAEGGEK